MSTTNRCICCGIEIPEGRQVCQICEIAGPNTPASKLTVDERKRVIKYLQYLLDKDDYINYEIRESFLAYIERLESENGRQSPRHDNKD